MDHGGAQPPPWAASAGTRADCESDRGTGFQAADELPQGARSEGQEVSQKPVGQSVRFDLVMQVCRLALLGCLGVLGYAAYRLVQDCGFWGLVGLGYVLWRVRAARRRWEPDGSYGTARFADERDIRHQGLTGGRGLILGRYSLPAQGLLILPRLLGLLLESWRSGSRQAVYRLLSLTSRSWWTREEQGKLLRAPDAINTLIVSAAGGGKSTGFAIPNLLQYPGSALVLDIKGELWLATAEFRRKTFGHAVYRFDPWEMLGPGGHRLNPLHLLLNDPRTAADDARALAEALVIRTGMEHERHFDDSAQNLIQAFLLFAAAFLDVQDRSIRAVAEMIADQEFYQHALDKMCQTDAFHGALRLLGGQLRTWIDREFASIHSSAHRHLSFLQSHLMATALSGQSDLDPMELFERPVTVYVVIPPQYLRSHAAYVRTILVTFLRRCFHHGAQRNTTVHFFLDEVGNLGTGMETLLMALTAGRGYGIRTMWMIQSLSQLFEMYPGEKGSTALSQFDYRVFFAVRDLPTAEYVSKCAGVTTIKIGQESDSVGISRPPWGTPGHTSVSHSYSTNVVAIPRPLITPDEVLTMPTGTALVFPPGGHPVPVELCYSFKDPAFCPTELTSRQKFLDVATCAFALWLLWYLLRWILF